MIKLKDAVEKYGEYEIDEKKLENILVKPKPKSVFDLVDGDKYYFINENGTILYSHWTSGRDDILRRNLGNMFLTYEEAEFEAERRKVEAELLKLGGTRDMMSLGYGNTLKYCMYYNHLGDEKIYINSLYTTDHQGIIFFKTEESCQRAIQEIGEDRIKKYIFNVKE